MTYELTYQAIHTVCGSVVSPPVQGYKCILAIISAASLVYSASAVIVT